MYSIGLEITRDRMYINTENLVVVSMRRENKFCC